MSRDLCWFFSSPCFPCICWGLRCSTPWRVCRNTSWPVPSPWVRRKRRLTRGNDSSELPRDAGASPCHVVFVLVPPEEAMVFTQNVQICFIFHPEGKKTFDKKQQRNENHISHQCSSSLYVRRAFEVRHLSAVVQYVVADKLLMPLKLQSLA